VKEINDDDDDDDDDDDGHLCADMLLRNYSLSLSHGSTLNRVTCK